MQGKTRSIEAQGTKAAAAAFLFLFLSGSCRHAISRTNNNINKRNNNRHYNNYGNVAREEL